MIIDEAVYLEHFGVKGMRWGERKAANNRQLNKESRKKDAAKQAKTVDKARANVASGKVKRQLKEAKAQYKKDRMTMGTREARKILAAKREKLYEEINTSQQARDGREAAAMIGVAVGGLLLSSIISAAGNA